MDVFDFPYHTFATKYPENGTRVQLGGSYVFTAPPGGPDMRLFSLHFPAMSYFPITPLLPEFLNLGGFTLSSSGSPASVASPSTTTVSSYDYPVYETTAALTMNTKGVLLPTAGKVWKVEAEFRVTKFNASDAPILRAGVRALDNGYNSLSAVGGTSVNVTGTGSYIVTAWFSNTASGNIVAWPGTATYLRFYAQIAGTLSTSSFQFRRMRVTDDTVPSINNVDLTTFPQRNLAVLEKFYQDHGTYRTFQYPHPVYGLTKVKFNAPIQIPEGTKGGGGIVENISVELLESST